MAIINTPPPSSDVSDVMNMVNGMGTGTTGKRGGFRQLLAGVVGAVGNMVAPGIGGALGSLISGGNSLTSQNGLLGDSTQYLQMQAQMAMEQRQFETASTILKNRHEAAMSAIRNMKAS